MQQTDARRRLWRLSLLEDGQQRAACHHCLPLLAGLLRHCTQAVRVDNGSVDGSAAAARAMFADAQVIEAGRGYHHAQSKLTYCALHRSVPAARRLRRKTLALMTLLLPLRLLAFSPRLLVRMVGRWVGLLRWSDDALEPPHAPPQAPRQAR